MGVVYACALSFISKYLYQSCSPKPMTRVDINDNNQSSNSMYDLCGMIFKTGLQLMWVIETVACISRQGAQEGPISDSDKI
jgi:hypothetical protein